MRLRSLTSIFLTPSALLEKLSKSFSPPMCGASNGVAITSGRCESRKLYVHKHPVHEPENFEMTKFSEKLTLVRGSGV